MEKYAQSMHRFLATGKDHAGYVRYQLSTAYLKGKDRARRVRGTSLHSYYSRTHSAFRQFIDSLFEHPVAAFFVGIALLGTLVAAVLLPTHNIPVSVSSMLWYREQQVENYVPRRYSDWWEYVPSDAYDKYSYRAVRSYRTVDDPDTESCSYSYSSITHEDERSCRTVHHDHQEPVYDTKVDYTANRWGYERSQVVSYPNDNPTPFWPTPDFITCSGLTCERSGARIERYEVSFLREDKTPFECDFSQTDYEDTEVAQNFTIDDGLIVHIPRCGTLERENR